jgi:hypothetical protein
MLNWKLVTRCCVGCDRAIRGSAPESTRSYRPTRPDSRRRHAHPGPRVGMAAAYGWLNRGPLRPERSMDDPGSLSQDRRVGSLGLRVGQ